MQDEKTLWERTGMDGAVAGTAAELKSWHAPQKPITCGEDILAVPAWYDEVDAVISLPKLKTHCLTTITCGLKNVYGLVSGPAKLPFHIKYPSPKTMAAFLVRVFAELQPHLTIADAVIAMEGNGPAHGRPLPVGVLLASRDAVALDAVGCGVLGIPPTVVPMTRIAAEMGLGCMDLSQVDCEGSGVPRWQNARLKPSLSRFLKHAPEFLFRLPTAFWQFRPKIVAKHCVKCANCVKNCPKDTILEQDAAGYPRINRRNCINCFCCAESCPQGAIAIQLYLGSLFRVGSKQRRKAGM